MKQNVGNIDKTARLFLAVVIGAFGFYYNSWWGLLAIFPLLTALFSYCPMYKILGINTCSKKSVQ